MSENQDFLEQVAGDGYGNIKGEAYATPFIKLLQPNSAEVTNEIPGCKAGLFYDSANKVVLGDTLRVVPLDMEILWMEWEEGMGGLKGKYLPGTIPTTGDRFNRVNPATGRELVDAWNYYILLMDKDGKLAQDPAIFSPPVTAIKYLRLWNTAIHNVKLASGNAAPFYSSIWKIGPAVKTKNDSGQVWYNIGDETGALITREGFINKEQFQTVITAKEMAKSVMLTYQPEVSNGPQLPPAAPRAALPASPGPY